MTAGWGNVQHQDDELYRQHRHSDRHRDHYGGHAHGGRGHSGRADCLKSNRRP